MPPNQNRPEISRRAFLQSGALLAVGSLMARRSLAAAIDMKQGIALLVPPGDRIASAVPSMWARDELRKALESVGISVRTVSHITDVSRTEFCIATSGMSSPLAQSVLRRKDISGPAEAESLCLVQAESEGRSLLLAAGTDPLGLVYALTELADRVSCFGTGGAALEFDEPVMERPASRTRSVMRSFNSEVEDKLWFYDREFWRAYLTLLVSSRLNRFSFPMGMGYNSARGISDGYFLFPYPFLVAVPDFDVRAKGLPEDERARNLATLKFVGEECARRGLRFQLGIWTLAYRWRASPHATYTIEGLTDATHATYCRDALTILLREVPAITGITFRVHDESGIPKGEEDFWKTQFSAIAQCGRRVEIDLHAKNMTAETLALALDTGQPVVISPKYCGEHLGLPYHQAAIRDLEMGAADKLFDTGSGMLVGDRKFTRYGYADTLATNRTWDVVFRIWPGTQRFLLNGDPATFAGYGRNASFCGAAGIEWSEPLLFKGRRGSGLAGGRCAYADTSLTPRRDFEKYLYTYRLWGRLGYNPDAKPDVWRRALRRDFGPAASAVENALAAVSRVLPLITLTHGVSANCSLYWPEIYHNMAIADERQKSPYTDAREPRLFGNASPLDPQLFLSPDECADALLAGRATGKYSPFEAAQWLEDMAAAGLQHIAAARTQLGTAASVPEFRRLEEDVLIQRGLALFFAGKFRCAVLWRIFAMTGDRTAGEAAIARYVAARHAWAVMAERARSVYGSNITYGETYLHGHWMDRISAFDDDIADLRKRLETPANPMGSFAAASIARAIQTESSRVIRPAIAVQHRPVEQFRAGLPLPIALRCGSTIPRNVRLHYRHVDQAERWQSADLARSGETYSGEIPPAYTARRFALQYYFEIVTGPSEATLFPLLAADLANVPYFVVRRST